MSVSTFAGGAIAATETSSVLANVVSHFIHDIEGSITAQAGFRFAIDGSMTLSPGGSEGNVPVFGANEWITGNPDQTEAERYQIRYVITSGPSLNNSSKASGSWHRIDQGLFQIATNRTQAEGVGQSDTVFTVEFRIGFGSTIKVVTGWRIIAEVT